MTSYLLVNVCRPYIRSKFIRCWRLTATLFPRLILTLTLTLQLGLYMVAYTAQYALASL